MDVSQPQRQSETATSAAAVDVPTGPGDETSTVFRRAATGAVTVSDRNPAVKEHREQNPEGRESESVVRATPVNESE
jgi:hypothetical protein